MKAARCGVKGPSECPYPPVDDSQLVVTTVQLKRVRYSGTLGKTVMVGSAGCVGSDCVWKTEEGVTGVADIIEDDGDTAGEIIKPLGFCDIDDMVVVGEAKVLVAFALPQASANRAVMIKKSLIIPR